MPSPWQLRLYLLRHLPIAFLAGLRLRRLTTDSATVTVPYGWLTQNPFRSIYFACLAMAAELASGLLAMRHVRAGSPVSMLITSLEASFIRKATTRTAFTCSDGPALAQAIAATRATGEPHTVTATSTGVSETGEVVAIFHLTWSFRARR